MILKYTIRKWFCPLIICILLTGCAVQQNAFEPDIVYFPNQRVLARLPSAFPNLTDEEKNTEWGKELYLGLKFAKEFDFYRAITCYKRALFLAPGNHIIEYHIVEAYYFARKYADAIEFYEGSTLGSVTFDFPAIHELLLILYESYLETGQCEKAVRIYTLIHNRNPEESAALNSYTAIINANFCTLNELAYADPSMDDFLTSYQSETLSETKARFLNAILPGAGYYYVGQTKAALTSFTINALFTYAAVAFFQRGYIAAGIITSSIEAGWYLGGINGAGLAAKTWNETIYQNKGKDYLITQKRFPILMFEYAF